MEVVIILCIAFSSIYSAQGQSNGDLRLVSRSSPTEGRLELYYDSIWGTVCYNDGFNINIANLACKKLGFLYTNRFGNVSSLGFVPGGNNTPIRQITCPIGATRVTDCTYDNVPCSHASDVALSCSSGNQYTDEIVRLVTRTGRMTGISSGRLEVFVNGQWGTVCDDFFDVIDTVVACSQLGFSGPSTNGNVRNLRFPPANSSTPIWLHEVRCSLADTNLLECPSSGTGNIDCNHDEDVVISCLGSGVLRLISSNEKAPQSSGRLEIYLNGKWGTVNSTTFTDSAADVACKQLGFTSVISFGSVASLGFSEGTASSPVWLSSVDCQASLNQSIEVLLDCSVSITEDNRANYDHYDDIGLVCLNPYEGSSTTTSPGSAGVIAGSVIGSLLIIALLILAGGIISVFVIRVLFSANPHKRHQVRTRNVIEKNSTYQKFTSFSTATEEVCIDDQASSTPGLLHPNFLSAVSQDQSGIDGIPADHTNVDHDPFSSDKQPLV